jgi:3-oxoacyl-[acyl-carrier protein] reductase
MDIDLTGKKAIVGGASRGIGRAAATELARLGASVTAIARSEAGLEEMLKTLDTGKGQRHAALAADLSDPAALAPRLAQWAATNGPCHILVNNSGGPAAGPAADAQPEQFLTAFTQHLLGAHMLAQALLPGMKEAGYGRIINVISTSVKQPIRGLGVSNTVRAAVASWAKTLAAELGPFGITVNNVLPGATDTDRMKEIVAGKAAKQGKSEAEIIAAEIAEIPARRFGRPEETGQAIAFLATPAAAYINGVNLPVDGGRTASL